MLRGHHEENTPKDFFYVLQQAIDTGDASLLLSLPNLPPPLDPRWRDILTRDAEARADRGDPPSLARYLRVFPWIAPGSEVAQGILAVELSFERPPPTLATVLARYGDKWRSDIVLLLELLDGMGSTAASPSARIPPSPVASGSTLAKYVMHRRLGAGSFGEVWLSWDQELQRYVALKLIDVRGDIEDRYNALLQEARAASAIKHPNVVGVRGVGRVPGSTARLFIDMEVCADPAPTSEDPRAVRVGDSLIQFATSRPMNARDIARLMADICSGVAAAHAQGVVHCDLKPGNVLVTPSGRPMIADFGLSVQGDQIEHDDGTTVTGLSMGSIVRTSEGKRIRGTPAYMSPEQARGEDPKPISDVYALGAVLYWLLTHRDPHDQLGGATFRAFFGALGREDGTPMAAPSNADPTLARILARATARRPSERYQSAAAMEGDLRAFLDLRVPPTIGARGTFDQTALFARRQPVLVTAVLVTVCGLTLGLLAALSGRNQANAALRESKATADFLTEDLLGKADPDARGPDTTVGELLDRAAEEINKKSSTMTREIEIRLRETIGRAYSRLGENVKAKSQLDRAYQLALESDDSDEARAERQLLLFDVYYRLSMPDANTALLNQLPFRIDEVTSAFARRHSESDPLTLQLRIRVGNAAKLSNDWPTATSQYERVLAHASTDSDAALTAAHNLASCDVDIAKSLGRQKRFEEQRAALERAADRFRSTLTIAANSGGEASLGIAETEYEYAKTLFLLQRFAEAKTQLLAVRHKFDAKVRPDHWRYLELLDTLAATLEKLDDYPAAFEVYRDLVTLSRKSDERGLAHEATLNAYRYFLTSLCQKGDRNEAKAIASEVLDTLRAKGGGLPTSDALGIIQSVAEGLCP